MFVKKEDPFFAFLAQSGEDCLRVANRVCRWLTADLPDVSLAEMLQAGDTRQQALAEQLLAAFMTPIDRRDLFALHRHSLTFIRAMAMVVLQIESNTPTMHRQRSALWIESCADGAKNVLYTFANYKKYAILQKKILYLRRTATAGLQLCAGGFSSGMARPLYAALLPVAQAAQTLADVAMEILIANL